MLSKLLRQISQVQYYSNPQKTPYHEEALTKLFINNGFKQFPNSYITFSKKEFWKNHLNPNWDKHNNIPNNVFISQPFGTQAPPDFIFKYKNILIPFEAKSSKDIF